MRRSNVVQFPSESAGGGTLKLFAVIFHLMLAYMFSLQPLGDLGLFLVLMIGLLFHLFVRRKIQHTPHFRQNAWLIAALFVLLIIVYQVLALLILLLAVLYWLMIGRGGRDAPYFLRYHILSGLVLFGLMLFPFVFARAFLGLSQALAVLVGLGSAVGPVVEMLLFGLMWAYLAFFWGSALFLAVSAVLGRTPYIPLVTANVRHWA